MKESIEIRHANENNLKNLDLDIPKNNLVVISGISGSGKSSLVFDIISNESQRRYFETFSAYARQRMGKMQRPDIGHIKGLSPSITLSQKTHIANERSTVGTLTEIYDYLRLLYARSAKSETDEQKPTRSLFSFNSPIGQCPHCKGLGVEDKIDINKLVSDENKTLREGALAITTPTGYIIYSQVTMEVLNQVCESHDFHVDIPWKDLTEEQKDIVLNGSDRIKIPYGKHTLESRMKWSGITAKPREEGFYKGILPVMENILIRDRNPNILRFATVRKCSHCHGTRLNERALSYSWNKLTLAELSAYSMENLFELFENQDQKDPIFTKIYEEIRPRLELLVDLGLGYLCLNQNSNTLSSGEIQRIRLSKQAVNGLSGIIYVFDEPSDGLHISDNIKLLEVMKKIRNLGNTVILVDHDTDIIINADHLIDLGPEAGIAGGELIYQGKVDKLISDASIPGYTGAFLRKFPEVSPKEIKEIDKIAFTYKTTKDNSLNLSLHQNCINTISGKSGIGKRELIKALSTSFTDTIKAIEFKDPEQAKGYKHIIRVEQSPIGRTPRSNPATYTGLFDHLRDLFAKLPESKEKGFQKKHFSFNVSGGRCEYCKGAGKIQVGMHFMSDVEITCPECTGKRFSNELLEVKYEGYSISDILNLEISKAYDIFKNHPKISKILGQLTELGLGYLTLGQSSTTISGGEAQRIKLATELAKNVKGKAIYILEEPTSGLHSYDIQYLLASLRKLADNGNLVICTEYNAEFILQSDWIIDLYNNDEGKLEAYSSKGKDFKTHPKAETAIALRDLEQRQKTIPESTIEEVHSPKEIILKGIQINNLKGLNIQIPHNKLTVLCGVSGSGKSSLAFNTLFAEGQKRFLESYSAWFRAQLSLKQGAEIEQVSGLTPTIAISQQSNRTNPRSTVGTVTEIYDMYRLLYSRIASYRNPGNPLLSSHFSFNHEFGACDSCNGLGSIKSLDPKKIITNPELSILDGAMKGSKTGKFYGDPFGQYVNTMREAAKQKGINLDIPYQDLNHEARDLIFNGTGEQEYDITWKFKRKDREGSHEFKGKWLGLVYLVDEEYLRKHNDKRGEGMLPLMKDIECPACQSKRLKKEYLKHKIHGLDIAELSNLSCIDSIQFFNDFMLKSDTESEHNENTNNHSLAKNIDYSITDSVKQAIASELIQDITLRLKTLEQLGLGYLQISRSSDTLSGGEFQRIRLSSLLSSEMSGLTYIIDEPTKGLHPHNTRALIQVLHQIKNLGNTIVVVEHDEDIIREADYIIEMGPGGGIDGGKLISSGSIKDLTGNPASITGKYLNKETHISKKRTEPNTYIDITGANANNLKDIDLKIPCNTISCVSGVSGSGKTSLLQEVIFNSAKQRTPINCKDITGLGVFDQIIAVNQDDLFKSSISTVLSYTKILEDIRTLFASTEEAKDLKLKKGHFSTNVKGGRCEECKGLGYQQIKMDFLSDINTPCEHCHGTGFQEHILGIHIQNFNIYNVMQAELSQLYKQFQSHKKIANKLSVLIENGLGYLRAGQSLNTLSGGEAQRLKMSYHIMQAQKEKILFIMDEPTTGLHMKDIDNLIQTLGRLKSSGHTVLCSEHNKTMIKASDFVIDLGPEGGEKGGHIVATCTPEKLIKEKKSLTGKYLC
jgi:excinuclease ABC subunit A